MEKTASEISFHGSIYTLETCVASIFGTFASSASMIAASYPAAEYLIGPICFGLEAINPIKLRGVVLAVLSCYCFAKV